MPMSLTPRALAALFLSLFAPALALAQDTRVPRTDAPQRTGGSSLAVFFVVLVAVLLGLWLFRHFSGKRGAMRP